MFKAEMIEDSIGPFGDRISTMLTTCPRIILAELNTHRMLSKNSASSRAVPFHKMLKSVMDHPFIPIRWMKDHSGMQGTEYFPYDYAARFSEVEEVLTNRFKLTDTDQEFEPIRRVLQRIYLRSEFLGVKTLTEWWLVVRDLVIEGAVLMFSFGVSKQICNRLLEPFGWITDIITGTDEGWQNFFALRVHEAAEIHMQKTAGLLLDVYNMSNPVELRAGEWHLPYKDRIVITPDDMKPYEQDPYKYGIPRHHTVHEWLSARVSAMMCARTSFTVVGDDPKEWTIRKYLEKFAKLDENGHYSPTEHPSMCMYDYSRWIRGKAHQQGWCKNFRGFIQLRAMMPGECRKDPRVLDKRRAS